VVVPTRGGGSAPIEGVPPRGMPGGGICYDNAMAESFFAALKNGLIYHTAYPTRERAKWAIIRYIHWYNRAASTPHSATTPLTKSTKNGSHSRTRHKNQQYCTPKSSRQIRVTLDLTLRARH